MDCPKFLEFRNNHSNSLKQGEPLAVHPVYILWLLFKPEKRPIARKTSF